MIYVDHSAGTPVRDEVATVIHAVLSGPPGNPSSIHRAGAAARRLVEEARSRVAAFIGAEPREIVFTAGGTESVNLAILGAATAVGVESSRILVTAVDHHAGLRAAGALERAGVAVERLRVDRDGRLDPETLGNALGGPTTLVSLLWVGNETGVIQDLPALIPVIRTSGALVHLDAVQAPGRVAIDVADLDVDLLSISGHKLHGPQGVGALYVRRGVRLEPIVHGGGHERGLRSGTLNVAGAVGLGEACRLMEHELPAHQAHLRALTEYFETALTGRFPSVVIHGRRAPRAPGISMVSIPGLDAEPALMGLDLAGICASSGAACTTGAVETSHVLRAMGVPEQIARGALRFSFGRGNTREEIDRILDELEAIADRVRGPGAR